MQVILAVRSVSVCNQDGHHRREAAFQFSLLVKANFFLSIFWPLEKPCWCDKAINVSYLENLGWQELFGTVGYTPPCFQNSSQNLGFIKNEK